MTDEQINAAIAEECGWADCRVIQKATSEGCKSVAYGIPNGYGYDVVCPLFATDLNAMHEAEMRIPLLKRCEYLWQITLVCHGCNEGKQTFVTTTANARQRAEAFLRTLGKWEEGK